MTLITIDDPEVVDEARKMDVDASIAFRLRRLDAAKAEAKALKEWEANGSQGERPDTSNLDAVNTPAPAGEKGRTTMRTTKTAFATERPSSKGAVPFRSEKHRDLVVKVVGKQPGLEVSGSWLIVPDAKVAQTCVDKLSAWASENRTVIYDARLAQATVVGIRRAFTSVHDSRRGAITALVDALNARKISWDVHMLVDGRVNFEVDDDAKGAGKTFVGTAKDVAAKLRIDLTGDRPAVKATGTKKAATTKAAPAKATAKKTTAAKKASPSKATATKKTAAAKKATTAKRAPTKKATAAASTSARRTVTARIKK